MTNDEYELDRNDYIVVGWKLILEKTLDNTEWDEDYYCDDGMDYVFHGGNHIDIIGTKTEPYAYFGKKVLDTDGVGVFPPKEFNPESFILTDKEIASLKKIFKNFGVGDLMDCAQHKDPKVAVFTMVG
jgi:hypothetical protein